MASYLMLLTYLGVKKKLVAASNKKDNRELQPWQKAITNDLYWSCSSSHGDVEVTEIMYHYFHDLHDCLRDCPKTIGGFIHKCMFSETTEGKT